MKYQYIPLKMRGCSAKNIANTCKYRATWKLNMPKCSRYIATWKVNMPKCSKYHTKWHVLVPTCCKYKASDFPRNPPKNTPYSQKRFENSGVSWQRWAKRWVISGIRARRSTARAVLLSVNGTARKAAQNGRCRGKLQADFMLNPMMFSINGDTQNGWFIPTDPAGAGRKMLTWLGFLLMGSMAHHI